MRYGAQEYDAVERLRFVIGHDFYADHFPLIEQEICPYLHLSSGISRNYERQEFTIIRSEEKTRTEWYQRMNVVGAEHIHHTKSGGH